jgi:hypothetical protein
MKIYDMIEGKWLKTKEKKEKEIEDLEVQRVRTRLVTYDEEKEWLRREKTHTNSKKILDNEQNICYTEDVKKIEEKI